MHIQSEQGFRHAGRSGLGPRELGLWALLLVLLPAPAYAYVDPGTGGMLVQLVAGGLAGIAMLGRLYWRKLRAALLGRTDPREAPPPLSD